LPEQHPIEGLMKTAMESIKEMDDVNTMVGDPVETPDGWEVYKRYQKSCVRPLCLWNITCNIFL